MNVVGAVFADFVDGLLGPSQLRAPLGSGTVLSATLSRLTRVDGLQRRALVVRERDAVAAQTAVAEAQLADRVEVLPIDDGRRPRRNLMRSARKWNLESWRGGLLSSTWFDEYVEPAAVARVMDHCDCEAVLCLDGHQPVLDPAIAQAMIVHLRGHADEAKLCFTQAPPGLAGIILRRDVTRELLAQQIPVGVLLGYHPEIAQGDPITRENCCQIDTAVARTAARLTGDTRRSRELLTAALAELGEQADAAALCRWLAEPGRQRAGRLPVEVELELTTDDPLPETTLRPRGSRVPRRQLHDLEAVTRLAQQLAEYDDRLLWLGGHGDPLRHRDFANVCRRIREAGVCGLGLASPLVELPDAAFEALFEYGVDVVQVRLDAATPAAYERVHNADRYERVLANVQRIEDRRRERVSPQPLVVASMTRSAATLPELEPFFDAWIRKTGSVLIEGYSRYGGLLPADSAPPLTPPMRGPCKRLWRRLTMLANGRAVACDQDVCGSCGLGDWTTEALTDIWLGATLDELRAAHRRQELGDNPLCVDCGEWFRP